MGVIPAALGGQWGRWVITPSGLERNPSHVLSPEFQRVVGAGGRVEVRLGHPVVDLYLEFLAARCRPNTVLAAGFDLKVFFALFPVEPTEVTTADVLAFISAQRASGDDTVVRLVDGESGLSARTIQRRLSSLSSMFSYLIVRGDVDQNVVIGVQLGV